MRPLSLLAASFLVFACADEPSTPAASSSSGAAASTGALPGSSTDATGDPGSAEASSDGSGAPEGSSSSGDAALEPITLEGDWVESVAGPWLGSVTGTPIGDLPQFFLDFTWNDDGVLKAVADNGEGFRLEFSFEEREGGWVFTELGELPGGFVQTQDLRPVERDGDRVRFEVLERPGYLLVEIEPTPSSFEMAVQVRGRDHGTFTLARPR
ncbi:MAG: hypothetical protein AAGA54_27430 [Myxococcota bacterium]